MIVRDIDVLVIGGGQAGLAMGYHLKHTGHRFQIVERQGRLGDSWRNRYDSLVLFTPRAYSALPGLPVPGDPNGYPTKDEMADYLERYAGHFELPVLTQTGIRSLTRLDGGFRARTDAKWVAIPEAKDADGGFVYQRGVSAAPGLYFMGRSWQWTRGSALLAGAGDDAAYVVDRISEALPVKMAEEGDLPSRNMTTAVTAESGEG